MNLSTSLTRDSLITSLMRYCASRSRTFEIHFFLWFFFLSEITKHESQTDVNRFQFQVRNIQEILLGGVGGKFSLFIKISQFTRNFIDRTPCIEQAQARVPRNLSCWAQVSLGQLNLQLYVRCPFSALSVPYFYYWEKIFVKGKTMWLTWILLSEKMTVYLSQKLWESLFNSVR